MTTLELHERIASLGPWFYPFELAGGVVTPSKLPPEIQEIFETRRRMMEQALASHFGGRLSRISAVDVGCHEGYYSFALRQLGVPNVLGIDFREDNLERASFVAETLGLSGLRFQQGDIEELRPASFGRFDLTLCFGLLYHLENPMRAIRRLYELTGELLLLETQVIDEVEGETEWGSRAWKRPYHGVLAVIDESAEYQQGVQETGSTPVVTCPSPRALECLLRAGGFREIQFLDPPENAYEQLARRKRVVVRAVR